MEEKEVRRIIDCEINKLKESIEKETKCDTEKLEAINEALKNEIEDKYSDNKENIQAEAEIRKNEVDSIYKSLGHKWDFVRWITSGVFASMGIMAGAFYTLIMGVQDQTIIELCQQGSYLLESMNNDVNIVIGYINQISDSRFDIIQTKILANCRI